MAEWSNAPDSKSGIRLCRIEGSNPSCSARPLEKTPLTGRFSFLPPNKWVGSAPALLGAALGDVSAPDIGQRALRNIRPFEKTTAAGRFVAALGENLAGEQVLWIDYASALSLHPLRSVSVQEHRLERLTSPTPLDNRISFGCVNVMPAFFDKVVQPVFTHTTGTVYVLPETRSWPSVFLSPSVRFEPVH